MFTPTRVKNKNVKRCFVRSFFVKSGGIMKRIIGLLFVLLLAIALGVFATDLREEGISMLDFGVTYVG